jgi:hypothetical protein
MRNAPRGLCLDNRGEWTNGARAPCSSIFKKNSKMAFESFLKIGTKNLDIDNNEIY